MGFHPHAHATNGFNAAQAAAAAHYAALQHREDRERFRDLEAAEGFRSHGQHQLDADDRSRSPQPLMYARDPRDLSVHSQNGINGGGGSSSISGDQASTIDDSDSDSGK